MPIRQGGYIVMHSDDAQTHYQIDTHSGWAILLAKSRDSPGRLGASEGLPQNMSVVEVKQRKRAAKKRAKELAQNNSRFGAVCFNKGDGSPKTVWVNSESLGRAIEEGRV